MACRNFNDFYDIVGLPKEALKIYYDFESFDGSLVPSVSGASGQYSGIYSSTDVEASGGESFFTGQHISVCNSEDFSAPSWSMMFLYQKSGCNDAILFSNLHEREIGGFDVNAGFVVGLTASNRLFFESYGPNGPILKVSEKILPQKNSLTISYSNNNLSFFFYDPTDYSVSSENFFLDGRFMFASSGWYIGDAVNPPSYFSGHPFFGSLDEFVYIEKALTPVEVKYLNSGFISNLITGGIFVETHTSIDITGYEAQQIAVGSGITGASVVLAGTVCDACGNTKKLFRYSDLYGTLYKSAFVPLSGEIEITTTGEILPQYIVDRTFCATFGFDGINYQQNITQDDVSDFIYYDDENVSLSNNLAEYDIAKRKFSLASSPGQNLINVFLNGVGQLPSGYIVTGDIYSSGLFLSGDYFLEGASIESNSGFEKDDGLVYDIVSSTGGYTRKSILNFCHKSGDNHFIQTNENELWFFNGQKLKRGSQSEVRDENADYFLSGDFLAFDSQTDFNCGETGLLFSMLIESGSIQTTGKFSSLLTPTKFMPEKTMLWLNGLRQTINKDYLEISKVDLLDGSGTFENDGFTVYNNGEEIEV